jgi:hypothetical protein
MTMQIRGLGPTPADHTFPKASGRGGPVRALGQALRAGDLGAASEAYAAVKAKAPQLTSRNEGPFAQLGAALASGDLPAARAAFASVFTSHSPRNGGNATAAPPGTAMPTTRPTGDDPSIRLDVTA